MYHEINEMENTKKKKISEKCRRRPLLTQNLFLFKDKFDHSNMYGIGVVGP